MNSPRTLLLSALALSTTTAFVPQQTGLPPRLAPRRLLQPLHSTISEPEAPSRIAPEAGWVPDWEDRPGLPDEVRLGAKRHPQSVSSAARGVEGRSHH